MKQEKKYFNLRLFFIGFVGMIFGILTLYGLLNILWLKKVTFWFVLFSTIFVTNLFFILLCFLLKDKRKYLKYLIIFLILFVMGFVLFFFQIERMTKYKTYDESVKIEGIVDSHYFNGSNYIINLKNVIVNDTDNINEVRLYVINDVPIDSKLSLGDKIEVGVDLTKASLVTDKIEISRYVNGFVYSGYVLNSDIKLINQKPNIIYSIQEKLKLALDSGLSNENSDIAYSILIGDKSELDTNVKEAFSFAGISHVLAVSGLHVGFLVAIITFILNLCKVGRRKRFFITSVILLFYCALCGFTPSVLRASFMTVVLLLAGVMGEEYDGLNSLGVAGILILLCFPQDLFSLGFQLSFMCVFMIITLADKMHKVLTGWNIPSAISSAISISLCVTIGSSILLANSLFKVSLISIVANLIVIPLFSITYPLLFILSLLAVIFPFLNFLLVVPEILLHIIKLIANMFAQINFAHFKVFNLGYLLLLLFVLLSIIVKFFMGSRVVKIPISFALTISCIVLVVVGSMPSTYNSFSLYTNYQYSSNSAIITTENNKKILVGIDEYSTHNFLIELKILHLDAVIIQDFEVNKMDKYLEFLQNVRVKDFVIPTNSNFVDKVFTKLNDFTSVVISDTYINDGVRMNFIKTTEEVVCGTKIKVNNKVLLFTNGITKEKLETLGEFYTVYDYIITNKSKYDFLDYGIEYKNIIHSNDLNFSTNKSISLKNKTKYVINL